MLSDLVITLLLASSAELEMRLALSRKSDKSSTEVKWAESRWYIDGSFLSRYEISLAKLNDGRRLCLSREQAIPERLDCSCLTCC